MYGLIFWVWFVGACGCFAYDVVMVDGDIHRDDIVAGSIEAAIWPIALFGSSFAVAYIGIRKVARLHNRWIKA